MIKPIVTQKRRKVKFKEFTGTIESFDEMAKDLGLCSFKRNYEFLDKKFNSSSLFQGIVKVGEIVYRKGDYYTFDIID